MLTLLPPAASASHFNTDYDSHIQWNLCGNICHSGDVAVADVLATEVENRRTRYPASVSVNEACESQKNRLEVRLSDDGYVGFFFPSVYVGESCGYYGNAILWRGGDGGTYHRVFSAQTASAEKRNLVCGRAVSPAFVSCSSHLVHNDASVATMQSDEARGDLRSFNSTGGVRAYIGADMNMAPSAPAMRRWLVDFLEADRVYGTCCRATTDGGSKIDYVYVPKARMRISHDAFIANSTYSDHHLYQAFT